MQRFRYQLQYLARSQQDYEEQRRIAAAVKLQGKAELRSYYFAGIPNLVVSLENEDDARSIMAALPRRALIDMREIEPLAYAA